jgi:hypothetical protein
MIGRRNPALRYRIMWAQPRTSYGRESPQPEESPPRVMRPAYDGIMLAATVAGAAAMLISLSLQIGSVSF